MPSCILNILDADALAAIVSLVDNGELLPLHSHARHSEIRAW